MFGPKKQSAPKTLWAVQVLTTEYFVNGSVQPDQYEGIFQPLQYRGGPMRLQLRTWTAAQIQPTGNLTTPVQTFPEWTLGCCANVVAIIPNDDASRQDAQKAFKDWKYPVEAVAYAGPYRIRGTVLSQKADRFQLPSPPTSAAWTDWGGGGFPVQGAEIDCQLPGSKLAGLQVPWLLLNAWAIHGFGVDQANQD